MQNTKSIRRLVIEISRDQLGGEVKWRLCLKFGANCIQLGTFVLS
jgi:hypothetical protein